MRCRVDDGRGEIGWLDFAADVFYPGEWGGLELSLFGIHADVLDDEARWILEDVDPDVSGRGRETGICDGTCVYAEGPSILVASHRNSPENVHCRGESKIGFFHHDFSLFF